MNTKTLPNPVGLRKAMEAFVKRNKDLFGNDVHFYSRKEWKERKEPYCNGSPFVMTFEGPLYDIVNYGEIPSLQKEFYEIIQKYGYYGELGYAWCIGFYN